MTLRSTGWQWLSWSNNPLGEALHDLLVGLTKSGVLDHDDETARFRWNAVFDWDRYEGRSRTGHE